jgi:hypothetical protein
MSVLGNQWIAINGGPVQMTARIFTRVPTTGGPDEFVDDTDHVIWSVDPAGIATVDRQGRVTPVANGMARVIATLGERSASSAVRVLPDYSGTWSGHYIITGCSGAADPRTCGRIMFSVSEGSRTRYPVSVVLSQDRDQVTGTLTDSVLPFPLAGFVRVSGALVVEATVPVTGLDPRRIVNWSSTVNASATQMSGAYTRYIASTAGGVGPPSPMRTEHEFTNLSRAQ